MIIRHSIVEIKNEYLILMNIAPKRKVIIIQDFDKIIANNDKNMIKK
jgi:hypothetical protein